ncbi:MAG: DUF4198 domain-containing protein [Pseudomonadota bacterium]
MPALAHQTFLLPGKFDWTVGEKVDVALTSALTFPNFEGGPAPDRLARVVVSVGGAELGPVSFEEGKAALHLRFTADRPGTAMVAISSKPRHGAIPAEDADTYFDEIGADAAIRAAFHALPPGTPLQRSYSKHAKAWLCIDACGKDGQSTAMPLNQPLEFIAAAAPRAFVLLRDGAPLAGHAVTIVAADQGQQETLTDAAGTLRLDPALKGVVMLTAVVITVPARPEGTYHSDYATLTLDLGVAGGKGASAGDGD